MKGGREGTDLLVPSFSGTVPSRKLSPKFEDKSRDLDQKLPHVPIISKTIVSCPLQIFEAKKSEDDSYGLVKHNTKNIGEVVQESRLSEKSEESHAIVKYLDGYFKLGWTEGPKKNGDVRKGKRKGRPKKESLISEFSYGAKKDVSKKGTWTRFMNKPSMKETALDSMNVLRSKRKNLGLLNEVESVVDKDKKIKVCEEAKTVDVLSDTQTRSAEAVEQPHWTQ